MVDEDFVDDFEEEEALPRLAHVDANQSRKIDIDTLVDRVAGVAARSYVERLPCDRPEIAGEFFPVLFCLFWFLVCYATTQLANQLHQTCIQVVRSDKVARKRLTESNGTPFLSFFLYFRRPNLIRVTGLSG